MFKTRRLDIVGASLFDFLCLSQASQEYGRVSFQRGIRNASTYYQWRDKNVTFDYQVFPPKQCWIDY